MTVLKFISTEPDFIPPKTDQDNALMHVNEIFGDIKIQLQQTENIEFVDQGENFESINCNNCTCDIEIQVWQDAMDKAFEKKFTELSFITPCCCKKTTLNDLLYHWPAGFAKFIIIVSDPKDDIKENELAKLERILNTKIRKIWAHY